ncbi:MAG TPA: transcription antitermination factor NusB [Lachnospiraceae bacterium]|jgi:transcription antitermination factor NusB|nr:transcription antitermination factor NusB [Lachnospiraceae bacterium]
MSRINARRNAFSLLFQYDFIDIHEIDENKNIFFKENPDIEEGDKKYILETVDGTMKNLEEIDAIIGEYARGWTTERMSKVDLAILRLAVYEMKFSDEAPDSVAINEAVELAKKYSSDEAPSFINGILGKISQR